MALVKFISGDGVEHEVEESSPAADIMRGNGFQEVGDHPAQAEPFVYTEEDAIAQNDGLDESSEAKAKAAVAAEKEPVKKALAKK